MNASRLLRAAVDAGDVPGVVAAATSREETLCEASCGRRSLAGPAAMSFDTVCWLASMTKPLVGAAAMQLVEQGRLELDSPAAQVIPELAGFQVMDGWDADGELRLRPPKRPMTLRQLLTHTSGFVYDTWNADMARLARQRSLPRAGSGKNIALRIPLGFDPGERWEYGIGIDWAGKMIEAASGMRLGAYLKQNLFDPLGMHSTGFRITPDMRSRLATVHSRAEDGSLVPGSFEVPQDPEFEPGGGGLYSCAGDYLRFMRMILNRGTGNGNRLLQAQTVDLMSRNAMGDSRVTLLKSYNPALSRDAEFFPGLPKTWGLSFMINEEAAPTGRSAGSLSWGGLSNCYFWIDPAKGIAGVYLTQILPFIDVKSYPLFLEFETAVYRSLA